MPWFFGGSWSCGVRSILLRPEKKGVQILNQRFYLWPGFSLNLWVLITLYVESSLYQAILQRPGSTKIFPYCITSVASEDLIISALGDCIIIFVTLSCCDLASSTSVTVGLFWSLGSVTLNQSISLTFRLDGGWLLNIIALIFVCSMLVKHQKCPLMMRQYLRA